jgi:hypothetical protein
MKVEDMRRRLQEMSAEDLRIVVARLYKMLPKKLAKERGADRLINDLQAFLKSAKVAKLPALPDIDLVEVETAEFIENAKAEHYFAPNRIISKSERRKWKFVAKRLYQDWCLLAAQPENLAPAAKALKDLYRIRVAAARSICFPAPIRFARLVFLNRNSWSRFYCSIPGSALRTNGFPKPCLLWIGERTETLPWRNCRMYSSERSKHRT